MPPLGEILAAGKPNMLVQVCGPDAKGVTWLRKLAPVGESRGYESWPRWVSVPAPLLGAWSTGLWPAQGGSVGAAGQDRAVSGLFLHVSRSPPDSGCLGFPPSPGWGPRRCFLPLWLSGPKWEGTPEAAAGCGV